MPVFYSDLPLPRLARGKVRDLYALDADHLLLVATDRLSAFDVVLPDPIPHKGATLTALSNFWFGRLPAAVGCRHHLALATRSFADLADAPWLTADLQTRAVIARRCTPLPVEAIVRGYLAGSGWKEYAATGAIGGLTLPTGLRLADPLPAPVFTPSTKAAAGTHDENIGFDDLVARIGGDYAEQIRAAALAIYTEAAQYAAVRGVLIADTKMEFGLDADGQLVLIDELLTPDSSRFWPADAYAPGQSPPSFDKQFVRDYLETLDWNKQAPGPRLPPTIIEQTAARYREAQQRLMA